MEYDPACLTHECSARLELLFKHSWIGTVIDEQFDWNCSSSIVHTSNHSKKHVKQLVATVS
jgi:hypothetical protein